MGGEAWEAGGGEQQQAAHPQCSHIGRHVTDASAKGTVVDVKT